METITLTPCDGGKTIWVTSESDQNGIEYVCNPTVSYEENSVAAMKKFLGIDETATKKLLNFLLCESEFRLVNTFNVEAPEKWLVEEVAVELLENSEEIFNVDYIDALIKDVLEKENIKYSYY